MKASYKRYLEDCEAHQHYPVTFEEYHREWLYLKPCECCEKNCKDDDSCCEYAQWLYSEPQDDREKEREIK